MKKYDNRPTLTEEEMFLCVGTFIQRGLVIFGLLMALVVIDVFV